MKVEEILNLDSKELEKMMTEGEKERMFELLRDNAESSKFSAFLDMLQESARLSGQSENEEHITISAYLDYLEDMKN